MPWSPLPQPPGDDAAAHEPVPLTELLDRVLAGLGAPRAEAIVAVHERWAELVGSEVATHARPVSIEHGALTVLVDNPAWANHLRWSASDVVARIGALVGEGVVTDVNPRVTRR